MSQDNALPQSPAGSLTSNPTRQRITLTLSGGGFRATLFHLGVIRFLYEARLLQDVHRIAAVSGGSVMGAHLVLNWERYTGDSASFDSAAQEIVAFVGSDVRGRVVRRWILTWLTILPRVLRMQRYTITNLLRAEYGRLYKNAKLKDLRGNTAGHDARPEIFLNCTSLNTGAPCRFGHYGFSWFDGGVENQIAAPETDISLAVAASSAFPPLFPPVTVSHETLSCDRRRFPTTLHLTDGGVYDNLGIDQLVWRKRDGSEDDLFIVSDAEGNFDWDLDTRYTFFTSRNIRASALIMKRVSDLEYAFYEGRRRMLVVKIVTEVDHPGEATELTPEIQRSLRNIRTDLDRFTPEEINCLVQHGAAVARQAAAEKLGVEGVPRSSWRPASAKSSRPNLTYIRRASSRRLRIWSYKDWASWVGLSVVVIALLLLGYSLRGAGLGIFESGSSRFMRFELDVEGAFEAPVVSPDGESVAFVSKGKIAIRRINQDKPTFLPGTEGGDYPFFSPDGKWLAFTGGGKLKKVVVSGTGPPITLCDASSARGGSWGADNNIVIALTPTGGLSRVPADGGAPEVLTRLSAEDGGGDSHRWPQTLSGGGVLFAATTQGRNGSLRVLPAKGGNSVLLVPNSTYGRFYNGYLIFYQRGALFAAEMDLDLVKLKPPFTLIEGVDYERVTGRAQFDVSESGTLVYRSGRDEKQTVSLIDEKGEATLLLAQPGDYSTPRFSPDDRHLALSVQNHGRQNLWVFNLGGQGRPLTFDAGPHTFPVWTPDGGYLVFESASTLAWTRARGGGETEQLISANRSAYPWSFSPDGNLLAFTQAGDQTGWEVWTARAARSQDGLRIESPNRLNLSGGGSKTAPAISPDGKWLAYASNETGRNEIYVTSLTEHQGKWQVSNGGGLWPIFSRAGRLFYESPDRHVVVVEYEVRGDEFVKKSQRNWSDKQLALIGSLPAFDAAHDGKRVVGLFDVLDGNEKVETNIRIMRNVAAVIRSQQPPSQ